MAGLSGWNRNSIKLYGGRCFGLILFLLYHVSGLSPRWDPESESKRGLEVVVEQLK
jgi:hypothetical protein